MILYSLRCANEHEWTMWFDNAADFDRQAADGALECPECGENRVGKAIMAPNLGGKSATEPAPFCAAGGCAGTGCAFAQGR